MIDSKDLRIGNFIQTKEYKTVFLIRWCVGIDFVDAIDTSREEDCGQYNLSDFEPIPLTEHWLERFGFVEQIGRPHVFAKDRLRIMVKDGLGSIAYLINEDNSQGSYIPAECNKVHQLQNLFYSLTGEELELTKQ